jgi:hypothetical protein
MCAQTKRSALSVAISNRGNLKNPWKWEICRVGESISMSLDSFPTMASALCAGQLAIAELEERA